MITDFKVWPIRTEEEMKAVQEAAYEDEHRSLITPSHYMSKSGEIIGAFSVESPTVYWWMHTQKALKKDSMSALTALDAVMADHGFRQYIVPCEESSPYYKLLTNRCPIIKPLVGRDWTLFLNK